jgi:hypothetical protein
VARDGAEAARALLRPASSPSQSHHFCEESRSRAFACFQNAGQGLGFKVPWLGVIDKKSMASYAAKLYTVLAAILTSLLALEPEGHAAASTAGDSECALSSAQAASIRALMADSNASCVYNMTVQSVRGSV